MGNLFSKKKSSKNGNPQSAPNATEAPPTSSPPVEVNETDKVVLQLKRQNNKLEVRLNELYAQINILKAKAKEESDSGNKQKALQTIKQMVTLRDSQTLLSNYQLKVKGMIQKVNQTKDLSTMVHLMDQCNSVLESFTGELNPERIEEIATRLQDNISQLDEVEGNLQQLTPTDDEALDSELADLLALDEEGGGVDAAAALKGVEVPTGKIEISNVGMNKEESDRELDMLLEEN